MTIVNSTMADIDRLFEMYDAASVYMKEKGAPSPWQGFERTKVAAEIEEARQWKVVENGEITAVFLTTYNDPHIWQEKDQDPAVYIHRIATHPEHRGKGYVQDIVDWAREHAQEKGKKFVRLDTGAGNKPLINYYIRCGFNFLGDVYINSPELPAHYRGGTFALLEIEL
ncbi:GNAT family N-acetyltransferase [Chitinophaga sp. Cy-1792]|uniref:GNAT family N-acetyltransferase n=1 Tax=Chitinophaga sp. Cy-1792 TaxID=2608339 RepID=UPI0014207FE8|nr:GNAT family N-acetyltransferase [Chitinophaga sp. Cy-1792]NIG56636.1 N-acetyltransferase [Chitinophaga sp. Cy-1792]